MRETGKAAFHRCLSRAARLRPKGRGERCISRRLTGRGPFRLPDGTVMTRADLPDPGVQRWVASRKAAVVKAVRHGLMSRAEALERYALSAEELEDGWAPSSGTARAR
jgi:hypothetical protein